MPLYFDPEHFEAANGTIQKDSIACGHAVLQKLKLLLCTHKAFFKHALADGNYFITSVYNGLFQ